MARPTGLQKLALDVPLKAGLIEKISPEMAPPEGMYRLENVELDKLGSIARRRGFEIMSSAVLGPTPGGGGVATFGTPKKVAGRSSELFVISEDQGYLGSGGGAGNAGSVLWSYSPESDAWRAHGKVPNCTLERVFGVVNGQALPQWVGSAFVDGVDAAGARHRYVVLAYVQGSWDAQNVGVHAMVWDATSRTIILEDTIVDEVAGGLPDMQLITVGTLVCIVYRDGNAAVISPVRSVMYDASTPDLGFSAPVDLTSALGSSGRRGWAITTNGTRLFLLEINDGRDVNVHRIVVGYGTAVTTVSLTLAVNHGADCEPGLSFAGGVLHATWQRLATLRPHIARTQDTLGSVIVIDEVHTDNSISPKVFNVGLSADETCVFWNTIGSLPNAAPSLTWRWYGHTNVHRHPGTLILTHPFVKNSRVFIGLTGHLAVPFLVEGSDASNGTNLGHVLVEVNSNVEQEDETVGNPYITPMPVALWARDISCNLGGARFAAPGDDGDVYITSVREARKSDSIFRDAAQQRFPTNHTIAIWSLDTVQIKFSNPKRWQHAEIDNQTVLACALPYVYDGERAHECGYVFRPGFYSIEQDPLAVPSGNWTIGQVVLYKVVYEWEDFTGRRWFSDSSYPYEVTIETSTALPTGCDPVIHARPPWLTMKPDGAHNFSGRVKVNIYRAYDSSPTEYKLIDSTTHMVWDGGGLRDLDYRTVTDSNVDFSTAEDIYTFGDELDNSVAPSCVSLIQHRDRLFAIDLETNSLCYTKPFRPGRGIEWSRFQNKALPQRGMALGSLEGSLIVLTDKSILVLDGPGPSATGVPPDAFARFAVLSQDQGCSELCAAWRCPRGLVFRSHQGLWLITPQMGIVYIGAAVEEVVKSIDYFIDGAVDERLGCLRLLGYTGGDYKALVYWYDSDRWSVDSYFLTPAGTQYSSTVLQGEYYMASSVGVRKRNDSVWQDGTEVVASGDSVYRAVFQTGWIRFDSAASFKRLWRVLLTLRTQLAKEDQWGIRVTVDTDDKSSTFDFYPEDFTTTGFFNGTLRAHLKYQKGQRFRITVSELQGEALAAYNAGYSFSSLGFELGMKRGAAKLGQERSPSGV